MSGFIRTADKVANTFRRSAIAVGTSIKTLGATPDPRIASAHGVTGSEQCILTVGLDGSYVTAATVAITCQYYSTKANQWFYAGTGGTSGGQTVTLSPGGVTTFTLPEQSYYFLSGDSAVAANLIWTDGMDVPGFVNTQTGKMA